MVNNSGGTASVWFIHTGQIDEPLAVTLGSQAIVWNAYVDPYGNATTIGTPSFNLNLRLLGQWYQLETGGLHQNGWRDYDPSLGRYIESDPLGINAGQNIYAYVDGDPLNFSDPSGKQAAAGAEIGAEIGSLAGPEGTVAGAIVGGGIGAIAGVTIFEMRRGNSDPATARGLKPFNPGKDCNGNCNPCPPSETWSSQGNAHGSTSGTHSHGIVWNQDPDTCMCYPKQGIWPRRKWHEVDCHEKCDKRPV